MTTPSDSPRARLVQLIRERIEAGTDMPWESRERRLAGVPRSGSSGNWYSGITPYLLWCEADKNGWEAAVWHTANSTDATVDGTGVKMGRSTLYPADRIGVEWPWTPADPVASAARVSDLANFLGPIIRPGRTPDYTATTGVLHLPAVSDFESPADHAATLLELLVLWTRDERRIDRDDDGIEPLVGALGGALLASAFRVPGRSTITVPWSLCLEDEGQYLVDAAAQAEIAVAYLLDLAHPDLLTELAALDAEGEAARPAGAGKAVEVITTLGQVLLVEELDLGLDDDDEADERTEPLVLAEAAAAPLNEFLTHFSHEEPKSRKNPPLSAWLTGGPGTGRNQVVAALNALFRTGGTDLGGTLVAAEGDQDLLARIEQVWSDERLMVLPAQLPSRVRVPHDRAIPTACLQAFHIRFGLSPHLWVARMEHRLLRSGEYAKFVEAFQERTGRSWRGDGHRNPEANKEAIIAALGGAAAGARRRVKHYEQTRQTASWEALFDEAGWSLFHLRPGELEPSKQLVEHAQERRVLFVLDLASALESDDPVARGWLRRCLQALPARMEDLASPHHRPLWFLLTPDVPMKELSDLVKWDSKLRRKMVSVDLDRSPVTAVLGTDLLGKDASACGPIFKTYALHRDDLHTMIELEGINLPKVSDRDTLLATFPFLPCVLTIAQAVLDTFAAEREALPLQTLLRRALDEQYYAPADRFVPLDVLLEPLAKLLEVSSAAAPAGVRIFVGSPAVALASHRAAFPHETVLQTVRWANRVRAFPCTAANLVPLMLMRMDRPLDELVAEVEATLEDLTRRENLRRVKGAQAYRWVRGL